MYSSLVDIQFSQNYLTNFCKDHNLRMSYEYKQFDLNASKLAMNIAKELKSLKIRSLRTHKNSRHFQYIKISNNGTYTIYEKQVINELIRQKIFQKLSANNYINAYAGIKILINLNKLKISTIERRVKIFFNRNAVIYKNQISHLIKKKMDKNLVHFNAFILFNYEKSSEKNAYVESNELYENLMKYTQKKKNDLGINLNFSAKKVTMLLNEIGIIKKRIRINGIRKYVYFGLKKIEKD